MARTQDFFQEMADWYGLPQVSTRASVAPASDEARRWPAAKARLAACLDMLFAWHERARERRALSQLSDQMLHDIGVSRSEATQEAARPFWRA